jgi:hypothetical protein
MQPRRFYDGLMVIYMEVKRADLERREEEGLPQDGAELRVVRPLLHSPGYGGWGARKGGLSKPELTITLPKKEVAKP